MTYYPLSHLSVISLTGPKDKVAEMLQGQISADVHQVIADQRFRQAALCNTNGRVLALMDLIDWDGYKLIVPTDLVESIIKAFRIPASLARISLKQDEQYQVYALRTQEKTMPLPFDPLPLPQGKYSAAASASSLFCYALNEEAYMLVLGQGPTYAIESTVDNVHGAALWHEYALRQKWIQIYLKTQGLFLPHRLDLQLSGHLDFQKGCYKGQEIIARMEYRSRPKHQLAVFTMPSVSGIDAGALLLNPETNAEIGQIVDYCPLAENKSLILASILIDRPDYACLGEDLIALRDPT